MSRKNRKNKKNKKIKEIHRALNNEIIGVILIALGLIILLSLFSLQMGIVGDYTKTIIFGLMGFGGYFLPIIIFITGFILISDKYIDKRFKFIITLYIILLLFLILLDSGNINTSIFRERIGLANSLSLYGRGGGILGSFFGFLFYKLFGRVGGYLILLFITLISIMIAMEIKVVDIINYMRSINWDFNVKEKFKSWEKVNKTQENKKQKENSIKANTQDIKILEYSNIEDTTRIESEDNNNSQEIKTIQSENDTIEYTIPPISLLKEAISSKSHEDKKIILNNAKIIEETINNFGIDATITQINKGPTITCYELLPSPGIKLNRIVSLADNIALSLAASDIRIEAPIPGKAAIGIEVPNKQKDNVYLKEMLLSREFKEINSNIPLALGKNVSGKPIVSSIDKMPHLLIAGATGSGKSVCINTIINSIIYKSSPNEVKLLLIDPKVVELSIYNDIPHLLIPVVTDAKKAASALNWAVEEMEKRYKLFAKSNVRDIKAYNSQSKNKKENKLSTIVVIIDELADLMMVAPQEIEDYISRLAQMARAAGIYLIVATQRPSVDVITGTIKANIPSRISFAVSSQIDSRTILDTGGAEKLLGQGDMLFYPSFYSKPLRIQGAFISDEEVERVVSFLKENYKKEYNNEVIEIIENTKNIELDNTDELLNDAIELVIAEEQASISMLQRRLRIGYARAARIVDEMESKGIIGGHEGSKPRKVLITKESLDKLNNLDN